MHENEVKKSEVAKKEEEILKFWKKNKIFEKSLKKKSLKGDFIFYEGPPTANGRPGIHHLEARAFKDAIPRFRTMQGYYVRRKGGWDTHGLPVELQVEKELGFKSKREIEEYGIEKFNQRCRESVWKYVDEWERFTERIGYWVDLENPYVTYTNNYIESVWDIVKKINDKGLIYKDYRVVPWCPRCESALSSHELAQGYEDVADISLYVKFKLKVEENTYLLAWTTTPWTLPANIALAVGTDINYVKVKIGNEFLILAKNRLEALGSDYTTIEEKKGYELVGLSYEPPYDFISAKKDINNLENAWKVYKADFVTTEEGTGIVHTAVMYGQDDFEMGKKIGLPKFHLVKENGHFMEGLDFLAGKFVRDEGTSIAIIKDLYGRELLLKKEKYKHSYPHCWRCGTPLIYYARDSWYIQMTRLREKLVSENKGINWEPAHIKEGRFGEWLRDVKDWALSRERYWGTPLPIWVSADGKETKAVGSLRQLRSETKRNTYYVMRHGEASSNVDEIVSALPGNPHHLTDRGKEQVKHSARHKLKKIDLIYVSDFIRTKETAKIVSEIIGIPYEKIIFDERLREINTAGFNLKPITEYRNYFTSMLEKFSKRPVGGENIHDVKLRVGEFLYEIDLRHKNKNILIITHEYVAWMLESVAEGLTDKEASFNTTKDDYIKNGEVKHLDFAAIPHNKDYELDFHKPYIDYITLRDSNEGTMKRVPEVIDVWFDSGSMPFAQDHYPFEHKKILQPEKRWLKRQKGYPADFISEAIDQTRGWFYTLHAIGVLLGYGRAYKNVISLGHILDKNGKKMSKSLGNTVDPWQMIDIHGADAIRFWMYSVNQPGESKNFDEKTVSEIIKKVLNLLINTTHFYVIHKKDNFSHHVKSTHILDKWIMSRLSQLTEITTNGLENYQLLQPSRAIREFIGDLSQWYVRRSRERFKKEDKSEEALQTLKYVLNNLSRIMAPLTPFISEYVYQETKKEGDPESVHLTKWPEAIEREIEIEKNMEKIRKIVEEGMSQRHRAGLKVRQPLKSLTTQEKIGEDYKQLLIEELNVKEILTNEGQEEQAKLDTSLSEDLINEGKIREFIRNVQELRKKKGLNQGDLVEFEISGEGKFNELIRKSAAEIEVSISASKMIFTNKSSGEEVGEGDEKTIIKIHK